MSKTTRSLAALLPELVANEYADLAVSGVCQDSRLVQTGDLFCARAGGRFKGTDFVADAIEKGAAAVLIDSSEDLDVDPFSAPVIPVKGLVEQMGLIASRFYGEPSRQLRMIGITGTNGKTSCSHFLAQALNAAGSRTAVIGTVGNGFPEDLQSATHTTPDAIGLQALLADLLDQGAETVVMEVSSHALDQHRVSGVEFDVAAFTNLSRDHLDYHGSMDAYGEAKARLFTDWPLRAAVICVDDTFGSVLAERLQGQQKVFAFGEQQGAIQASGIKLTKNGLTAQLQTPWGEISAHTQVVGQFNLWNLMLTTGVLGALDYSAEQIESLLAGLTAVPGRMECLGAENQPLVVVDYAHTPDALEKALQAAREHTEGDLVCVFGCGGDRDQGKRAEMGKIARQLADKTVVTSDNPRTEDPQQIIAMILQGTGDGNDVSVLADRAEAIRSAVLNANENDVVLVAGKGHEDYQEVNGVRLPFLDRKIVLESLQEWRA